MAQAATKRRRTRSARPAASANVEPALSDAADSKDRYLAFMERLMRHMQSAIRNNTAVTKGATYYGGYEMTDDTRAMVNKAAHVHGFDCTIDTGGMDAYSIRLRYRGGNAK